MDVAKEANRSLVGKIAKAAIQGTDSSTPNLTIASCWRARIRTSSMTPLEAKEYTEEAQGNAARLQELHHGERRGRPRTRALSSDQDIATEAFFGILGMVVLALAIGLVFFIGIFAIPIAIAAGIFTSSTNGPIRRPRIRAWKT